jgi:hypothetical protein
MDVCYLLGFPIVTVSIDFDIAKTKIGNNQRAAAGGGKGVSIRHQWTSRNPYR